MMASASAQRLVDFARLLTISQHRLLRSPCFLYLVRRGFSPYAAKRALTLFLLSSYSAQRLVDFARLLTISQHRLLRSPCFLYLVRRGSSPYAAKRALTLFLLDVMKKTAVLNKTFLRL